MFLRDCPDPRPFRDVILNACLNDLRYDRQIEDGRAGYLFRVLRATGEPQFYLPAFCDALHCNDAKVALFQINDLVGWFSGHGFENARSALHNAFQRWALGEVPNGFDRDSLTEDAAKAIIDWEEVPGFAEVAQTLAQYPFMDDAMFRHAWLVGALFDLLGKNEAAIELSVFTAEHPEYTQSVQRLLDDEVAWESDRENRHPKLLPPPPSYEEIKASVHDFEEPQYNFTRWGRNMDEVKLRRLAEDLVCETKPELVKRYLRLFYKRPFPLDLAPLIALTKDNDEYIAHWAMRALEQVTHPDVRALGLQFARETTFNRYGLDLLARNPGEEDAQTIRQLWMRNLDDEDAHTLGMSLTDYLEENTDLPEAEEFLRIAYERTPCSLCRGRFAKDLYERGGLTPEMLRECRYDADDGVRELARTIPAT